MKYPRELQRQIDALMAEQFPVTDEQVANCNRIRPKQVEKGQHQRYFNDNRVQSEYIAAAMDAQDWHAYVDRHHKEWQFEALLEAVRRGLSGALYWQLVTDVWQMSDRPGVDEDLWVTFYGNDMPPGRRAAMNSDELAVFDALPDVVTLYRGALPQHRKGMAWSLERRVAEFFATEHGRRAADGLVYCVQVPRSAMLVYYSWREEAEVLVLPKDLPEPQVM